MNIFMHNFLYIDIIKLQHFTAEASHFITFLRKLMLSQNAAHFSDSLS